MCDTLVALGHATKDGSAIFAKNSDREPNEAHQLLFVPHAYHPEGSEVQCTYKSIPQIDETFAVLLSKPFWIWGGEMGANEKGVVIGNEALFSKLRADPEPGLIGMDFLRLALERGASAVAARDVIISLLEIYGQSGNCGLAHPTFYHNSYLIADAQEAWVLETVGKQWAAVQVKDIRSISNVITIGDEWDLASDGLVDFAIEKGWCKNRKSFNFSRCYSDAIYTGLGRGRERRARTTQLLKNIQGQITVKDAMAILRDHGRKTRPGWTPAKGLMNVDICMHAGFGPIRIDQTTGSMVSSISTDYPTHWVTGTAAPCTGIFKPVWLDAGLPDLGPIPDQHFDPSCLWWHHEALHREVLRDYSNKLSSYRDERDQLEDMFVEDALALQKAPSAERARFSIECFEKSNEALQRWNEQVREVSVKKHRPFFSAMAWRKFNTEAEIINTPRKTQ